MSSRRSLMVATPCFGGQVTTVYANSLLRLQAACRARSVDFEWLMLSGDALITRARADLVAHFLDRPDGTHFLFIDADIGFEPEQVFRLLDFDADMTACAYPAKRIDWQRVREVVMAGLPDLQSTSLEYVFEVEDHARIVSRDGFAKVRFAGTGFLMMRRGVLTALCAAHPQLRFQRTSTSTDPLGNSPHRFALFDCMIDPVTGVYLSEDYAFCRRWTAMGGEIWMDTQSRLTHVGPIAFAGNFATQFRYSA
ncbi:MAG TPA: hypothetical protein VEI03_06840 [Stellaceae bacterium]|nr:hypothetical protein [Stellaceae bacterium]